MKFITPFVLQISISLTAASQDNILHVTQEFPAGSAKTVQLNNKKNITIEVIPWTGSTVKIVFDCDTSAIQPEGDANNLSSYKFEIKRSGNKIIIFSDATAVLPVNGDSSVIPFRNKATIYFPKRNKLEILSTNNANITLTEDAVKADIRMAGGSLQTKGIDLLYLNSVLSDINLGTIGDGVIDINGGELSIENINKLAINSRYTQPKIRIANVIGMTSLADNYTINEVETLAGSKTYGSCIIGEVKRKIVLNGKSIGLQIADIKPEVELIKINSINDSLFLPVSNLANYLIAINATGNSELSLTDAIRNGISNSAPLSFGSSGKVVIISKVGDTKNKHTVFDINCYGSMIKFK